MMHAYMKSIIDLRKRKIRFQSDQLVHNDRHFKAGKPHRN